jgi:hypothetical protein
MATQIIFAGILYLSAHLENHGIFFLFVHILTYYAMSRKSNQIQGILKFFHLFPQTTVGSWRREWRVTGEFIRYFDVEEDK